MGTVFLRSLMRSQLRLSLALLAGLALVLGAVPVLGAVSPRLLHDRVGPVPVPWLVLAVAAFPAMLAAGVWYVRAAERTEAQFEDLVRRR